MNTASDMPHSSAAHPHIVVIEDDDNLLHTYGVFLRHFLSADPVELFCAIEPAVDYLHDATPDIILTDLSMPSVEGAGVVSVLHDAAPDVPILVISGSSSNQMVRESLDGGAIGYVLKGKRSEIVEGVEAALRGESYLSGELRG